MRYLFLVFLLLSGVVYAEDFTFFEGTTGTFTVTATDPDGDLLTYSASNLPNRATFENQIFSWKPSYRQAGFYPDIVFTVSDGFLTDTRVVNITVENTNRRPRIDPIVYPPVTLKWDAVVDDALVGYKVYRGIESRVYIVSVDVGNVTSYPLLLLPSGLHYFAVTAYNADGEESAYSDEVTYQVN